MPRVRLDFEAVRYLAALAKYNNCHVCSNILRFTAYNMRAAGLDILLSDPYNRGVSVNRALRVIAERLSKLSNTWYYLVEDELGRDELLSAVSGLSKLPADINCGIGETELLSYLRTQEVILTYR